LFKVKITKAVKKKVKTKILLFLKGVILDGLICFLVNIKIQTYNILKNVIKKFTKNFYVQNLEGLAFHNRPDKIEPVKDKKDTAGALTQIFGVLVAELLLFLLI
jgi:hypothetical protein